MPPKAAADAKCTAHRPPPQKTQATGTEHHRRHRPQAAANNFHLRRFPFCLFFHRPPKVRNATAADADAKAQATDAAADATGRTGRTGTERRTGHTNVNAVRCLGVLRVYVYNERENAKTRA